MRMMTSRVAPLPWVVNAGRINPDARRPGTHAWYGGLGRCGAHCNHLPGPLRGAPNGPRWAANRMSGVAIGQTS